MTTNMANVNVDDDFLINVLVTADAFMNESSDTDEELLHELATKVAGRNIRPKVDNYAELTVPLFDNSMFRSHFRLSRSSFQFVLESVRCGLMYGVKSSSVIDPEKQLLLTIWTLANQESFRYGLFTLVSVVGPTVIECNEIMYISGAFVTGNL